MSTATTSNSPDLGPRARTSAADAASGRTRREPEMAAIDGEGLVNVPQPRRAARWEPLTGIAFVVFFIGSVAASSPPKDNAPDSSCWLAAYTGRGHQAQHLATGVLLVLAALSLMSLLNALWRRIAEAQRPAAISPPPLVAAGVSAACIAAGGVVMAYVSGGELIGTYPLPAVDILRLSNDLGFALVSVAGMLAAALSVACLSIQGRAAGVLGRKMTVFGLLVAVYSSPPWRSCPSFRSCSGLSSCPSR